MCIDLFVYSTLQRVVVLVVVPQAIQDPVCDRRCLGSRGPEDKVQDSSPAACCVEGPRKQRRSQGSINTGGRDFQCSATITIGNLKRNAEPNDNKFTVHCVCFTKSFLVYVHEHPQSVSLHSRSSSVLVWSLLPIASCDMHQMCTCACIFHWRCLCRIRQSSASFHRNDDLTCEATPHLNHPFFTREGALNMEQPPFCQLPCGKCQRGPRRSLAKWV